MSASNKFFHTILLSLLLFLAVPSVAGGAEPERASEAETVSALKADLEKQSLEDRFSGAVLIAKDGKPVFQSAYGFADRENKTRNTIDTKFRFGSMGKMFTAVAVLQLAQAGRIQLEAPLSRYLPGYPNKDVARVTIHQLLTHTGGTGDIFSPDFDEHRLELKEISDYLQLYGARGLQFTPGSKWEYSNYGFILLGRIVEVVSGQTYYDYVHEHIFNPAGMNSTGNSPEDQHVADLAIGYSKRGAPQLIHVGPGPGAAQRPGDRLPPPAEGPLRSTSPMLPYRGTSAGGGYSTVGDFLQFVNALASGKLLDAQYTALLTTGKVTTPRPGTKYAYGFEDHISADGTRTFGHGGGAPGSNGRLAVYPSSGYVVVILANLDPPCADDIGRFIDERLPAR